MVAELLILLALLLCGAGCADSPVASCSLRCGDAGACPSGATCGDDGFCRSEGDSTACAGGSGGTGGTGSGGTGSGGSGGSGGTGSGGNGGTGSGGNGGTGSGGSGGTGSGGSGGTGSGGSGGSGGTGGGGSGGTGSGGSGGTAVPESCFGGLDEDRDGLLDCADDDCIGDGLCGWLPGDLVITELMIEPHGTDEGGEWLELYNASGKPMNLRGLRFEEVASGDDLHVTHSLPLATGGFVLLGQASADVDVATDLGPDELYSSRITFPVPPNGSVTIMDEAFQEIDTVFYGSFAGPLIVEGLSIMLDGRFLDATQNDSAAHWCTSPSGDADAIARTTVEGTHTTDLGNPRRVLPCP